MAKRERIQYTCSACGYVSSKWNGCCPGCGTWNTLEESFSSDISQKPLTDLSNRIRNISEVGSETEIRYSTGCKELDRVLGGGLVKGSIVLLGGEPGIGKSTLLLQICQFLGNQHRVLYVSGEESARQIGLRAQRLQVDAGSLYILTETDAQAVCDTIASARPA